MTSAAQPRSAPAFEAERITRGIVQHLPVGILVIGPGGDLRYANAAAKDLLGEMAHTEDIRSTLRRHDELSEVIRSWLADRDGAPVSEISVASDHLGRVPVEVRVTRLREDSGEPSALLFLLDNVAAARRRDADIRRLERLAALGRFTAAVAHEVRNPLAGIAAGVQYLAAGSVKTHDEQETVRLILAEIKRLDRIVAEIFDAGRPTSLRLAGTAIEEPVRRAIAIAQEIAARRGVQLAFERDASLPQIVIDEERIEQVLLNLVKNAIEFSPNGGTVRVRTRLAAGSIEDGLLPERARACLAIEIADCGSGIAADHLSQIFEPFFSGRAGGTGLGLYVSQMIVEAHGGAIRVESAPERGSTFTVLLPYARESRGAQ